MFQHLDPRNQAALVLMGLLVVLTLVEMALSYWEDRKYYQTRDTLTNIYLTSLAVITNLCVKVFTFFILDYTYQHYRLFQIQNVFWYWFVLVVVQDFLYWVLHYTGHYCRMFWAMHVTHHSSEHFNFTTGFRSTVFEPLYRVFFYLPLALMGFTALDILYAYLITQLYGNLVHTQYKIPLPKWYGWIFVTPAHHRVHHASNIPYLDKNMGMVLIIWDRLFGTFRDEDLPEPVKYGLTKQPEDMGPVNVLFHEWKALLHDVKNAPDLKSKISYFLNPPGWSHDGSTQTARVLQREYKAMEGAHRKHETAA
ncbi:sterol desaturase/sphingolipid hydroxylase (fatty acid hydroxylase superfamily) [Mucilaginibacter sp. SG538B]|jgi:sterol desaturase/sphingolipid hydroxylase (fatty acid hydroxylase superfamily)|uniref:sterol desaturase family protein n=1 Tax=unclassified Mucilaginibacter TaxID=2617802 RepID=UPI00159D9FF3|nr:sterol desaturase family protein [Mucilaginibacter sp. SG538B]NVM67720.1 sterol desaturase/sphingolipid hydroxylase (fatty acid hydroxylase superfamily) [Mucilaginibacter sp. SG538B]